jgi:hypothetical protein
MPCSGGGKKKKKKKKHKHKHKDGKRSKRSKRGKRGESSEPDNSDDNEPLTDEPPEFHAPGVADMKHTDRKLGDHRSASIPDMVYPNTAQYMSMPGSILRVKLGANLKLTGRHFLKSIAWPPSEAIPKRVWDHFMKQIELCDKAFTVRARKLIANVPEQTLDAATKGMVRPNIKVFYEGPWSTAEKNIAHLALSAINNNVGDFFRTAPIEKHPILQAMAAIMWRAGIGMQVRRLTNQYVQYVIVSKILVHTKCL